MQYSNERQTKCLMCAVTVVNVLYTHLKVCHFEEHLPLELVLPTVYTVSWYELHAIWR